MAAIRVHELAKELGIPSKELLGTLESMNVTVKSHMSALDDETVASLRGGPADPTRTGAALG